MTTQLQLTIIIIIIIIINNAFIQVDAGTLKKMSFLYERVMRGQ